MRRIVLLATVALGVLGCNSSDTSALQRDASQLGKTATRAATNATVAGKVSAALALRKGVEMKGLHIEAEGGIVTISGHVNSPQEKKTILEVAKNTVGVDRVIDKINVAILTPSQINRA